MIDEELFKELPWDLQVEIADNIHSKQYTPIERSVLARKILGIFAAKTQQGQRSDISSTSSKFLEEKFSHGSLEKTANLFGESHETVRKRILVLEESEKNPTLWRDDVKKYNDRHTSLDAIYKKMNNNKKAHDLIEATNNEQLPATIKLIEGDLVAASLEIPDISIELIFTDPPYGRESLSLYERMGSIAVRVLKDRGSLVTYVGHDILNDVINSMEAIGLKFWHQLIVLHSGNSSALHPRHVYVKYKSLLWFVKGSKPLTDRYLEDVIPSKAPNKTYHEWAQSTVEAEYVIEKLTNEGGVVLDCFMGSGTTGIAALRSKRKFIGIDQDQSCVEISRARLAEACHSADNCNESQR